MAGRIGQTQDHPQAPSGHTGQCSVRGSGRVNSDKLGDQGVHSCSTQVWMCRTESVSECVEGPAHADCWCHGQPEDTRAESSFCDCQ